MIRTTSSALHSPVLWGVLPLLVAVEVQAQKQLVVGLYAPSIAALSRVERIRGIESLAKQLGTRIGMSVTGQSFARGADLTQAAKQRRVHIALVSAQFAAESGWEPFAVLQNAGGASEPWAVFAPGSIHALRELAGKTLVLPRVGAQDRAFVVNVMLESEVDSSFFKWLQAPDATSAIQLVAVGKAAAAVVPRNTPAGALKALYVARAVPMPAAVFVAKLPAKLRDKVRSAMLNIGQVLGHSGFGPANPASYVNLRRRLLAKAATKRPLLPPLRPLVLGTRDVWTKEKAQVDLPPTLDMVALPTIRPDQSDEESFDR